MDRHSISFDLLIFVFNPNYFDGKDPKESQMQKFLQDLYSYMPWLIVIVIILIAAFIYCYFVLDGLIEEIKVQQPDRRDEFSWSNFKQLFEIFLPMTQVSFLGRIFFIDIDFLARAGVIIIAVLSGYGAVNTPVSNFNIYDARGKSDSMRLFSS